MEDQTDQTLSQAVAERLDDVQLRLLALQRELEHSQRLAVLGTLAAGAAHEVNNVLTPVVSYAHFARSNPSDAALQAKALERIISGVEAASRILTSMLDFAAPESGDAAAECAVVRKAVDAAIACLARDPAKDGLRVRLLVPDHAVVRMSPLALQQVLLNLILNACRAMREQGGELTIRVIEQSDGRTRIDVADTGPGIPVEIAARLFQPFVSARPQPHEREDESKSREPRGCGLGLSVCRQLIERAGGEITATSIAGRGSTFSFALPSGDSHINRESSRKIG